MAEQTKSGIVDDILNFHSFRGQTFCNFVAGSGVCEIASNKNWCRASNGDDFVRQRHKAILTSVNQGQSMAL